MKKNPGRKQRRREMKDARSKKHKAMLDHLGPLTRLAYYLAGGR